MIISLSGKPGSGKSTVAKKLAKDLGYERYYMGRMFREAAKKRGLSLLEFLKWAETDERGDKEFDKIVTQLGQTKDNLVIESRTAFHFIPHSLKIFLDIKEEEGAKRIWLSLQVQGQQTRNEDKNLKSYEDVLKSIKDRIRSETVRYQNIYGLNIFNKGHYDLFLDTTHLDKDKEYKQVYKFVQERLEKT
ncbi:cytidylate kinase family protein [Patescibacteria group bacterium]|nr:cytidylate kinase family protein [Patescibacteria group bacterium]MBU0964302.1 cytidylate kinase family protein [Patescibacteria group bacterium]